MWWNSMSTLQQVMFVIACVATAVLILQIILMLVGGASDGGFDGDTGVSDIGGSGDIDLDVDADADVSLSDAADGGITDMGAVFGMRLLSLRSIMAFIVVGAWVCYTVCYALDWYWAVMIAAVSGFAAACAMAGALIGMEKLQDSGNIDPDNAVGKVGTVYLTVPPLRSGKGKVNILVQERYAEYDAVTDSDEPLPTGTEIKVKGNIGGNVLLVTRYKKPSITIETE